MLSMPACNHTEPVDRRYVMIFIDMSLSTLPDRENYRKHIETIVNRLKAGDRLTVCQITDQTIAEFAPIFDTTLPSFNFWTDNRTRYDKAVRDLSAQIMTTVDSVLQARPKVKKSEIINSFLICEQFMRNKQGKKSIAIFSDMQESSVDMEFSRDTVTAQYIHQAIVNLKSKDRIPKLKDVEVWIAGAYAKSTEQYFAVEQFWSRYIQETGAVLKSYSHTLIDFE